MSHHFNTPPEILDKVRLLAKQGIGLDPCSNKSSFVNAKRAFCGTGAASDDGLVQSWRGYGLVFMNPPHSMSPNNIEPWMLKAHEEFGATGVSRKVRLNDQFVGLIPAKTDTAWFHNHVMAFDGRVFLRGRPKFWFNGAPMPGPGKFASMLIYAGNKLDLFREIFADDGWVV